MHRCSGSPAALIGIVTAADNHASVFNKAYTSEYANEIAAGAPKWS